jgi:2-amino-4-hydroxy-6-hydroxymethyldihydropteridine diphosphokinase
MKDIRCANHEGAFLVVHAHGDNIEKIRKYVPDLNRVMGTTQSTPLNNVYNFGGFTDGDRCLFLAVELGAEYIILGGMDFGKIVTKYSRPDMIESEAKADEIKQLKLQYAKKLVEWIAENEEVTILNISRGEHLDGILDVNFIG